MADKSIGRILIVDDVPLNRELLALRLGRAGYATFQAEDGHGCLSRVAEGGIDMVILDVMMPDMSGIEVLKILREGHSMTDLPVIMATARTESDHVVEALNLGANDYVTKPIDFPILFARMRTHMALKRLSQQKDEFLQIASHDLKNPLCVVLSAVRMVEDLCPPGTVMCQDFHRLMAGAGRQALAMKGIIENYLDIQAAEDGQLSLERSPTDLAEMLRQAVESQRSYAHSKSIVLVADAEPCTTDVDPLRLRQVLDNLLGNAIKFSDPGTTAVARLRRNETLVTIDIQDEGPGFGPDDIAKLFIKYGKTSNNPTGGEKSSGLGLAICRQLVHLHGGDISAKNNDGAGATFTVRLPV